MVEVEATQQSRFHALEGLKEGGERGRERKVTTTSLALLPFIRKAGKKEGGREGGKVQTYLDVRVKSRVGFRALINSKQGPLQAIHLLPHFVLFLPPFLGAFHGRGR
jgi:hypothetical protein